MIVEQTRLIRAAAGQSLMDKLAERILTLADRLDQDVGPRRPTIPREYLRAVSVREVPHSTLDDM